jgi:hypothetical protein
LDRFTGGRFYNPRSALDMNRIPVDPIQPVEIPDGFERRRRD